ncbi:hypothetical protein KN986_001957 [Salmonella enterica subsp. enterica serovar Brandenburg]|nr:hypothetical protein [Salmonella enterica subsp. enterica serovar Brandenburg]EHP1347448.1 hypothetical protein [Salmonella enterica subsp. enterica serovar Brandenburg]
MFTPGDFVQPRMGGPKLKVIEVNEDHIVAVQASNEQGATFPESRLIETGNEAPSVKGYP